MSTLKHYKEFIAKNGIKSNSSLRENLRKAMNNTISFRRTI